MEPTLRASFILATFCLFVTSAPSARAGLRALHHLSTSDVSTAKPANDAAWDGLEALVILQAQPAVPAWHFVDVAEDEGAPRKGAAVLAWTGGNTTVASHQQGGAPKQRLFLHPAARDFQVQLRAQVLAVRVMENEQLGRRMLLKQLAGSWGQQVLTTFIQRLTAKRVYSKYIALLQYSGWMPIMQQYIMFTPITALVFNNAAYAALPARYQAQLKNKVTATQFLQYHFIQQVWPYAALATFKPSPYPTVLNSVYVWRQPVKGKNPISFGVKQNTPVAQQAAIVARDFTGSYLRLLIGEGVNKCLIPPGVFK